MKLVAAIALGIGLLIGWQLHNLHYLTTVLSIPDPTGANRKGIRWY